jgi:hypothetical protein
LPRSACKFVNMTEVCMRNCERGLADVLLRWSFVTRPCSQASQIMYNRAFVNAAISKSLVSGVSNVWSVMLEDGQCFLITPAHSPVPQDFGIHWTKVGSKRNGACRQMLLSVRGSGRRPILCFAKLHSIPADRICGCIEVPSWSPLTHICTTIRW